MTLISAKDSENFDLKVGVSASGISVFVYQHLSKICHFPWENINKICYKKNDFYVKLRPDAYKQFFQDSNGFWTHLNYIGFKLANRKEAKRFWQICVDHHQFFNVKDIIAIQEDHNSDSCDSNCAQNGKLKIQALIPNKILHWPW